MYVHCHLSRWDLRSEVTPHLGKGGGILHVHFGLCGRSPLLLRHLQPPRLRGRHVRAFGVLHFHPPLRRWNLCAQRADGLSIASEPCRRLPGLRLLEASSRQREQKLVPRFGFLSGRTPSRKKANLLFPCSPTKRPKAPKSGGAGLWTQTPNVSNVRVWLTFPYLASPQRAWGWLWAEITARKGYLRARCSLSAAMGPPPTSRCAR